MNDVTVDLSDMEDAMEEMLWQKLVGKNVNYRHGRLRLNPNGKHIITAVEFTFGNRWVVTDDYYGGEEEVPSFFIKVQIETLKRNNRRWIMPMLLMSDEESEIQII